MDIEYFDTPEDPEVEYVLVNTCGFSTAREESEQTLRHFDELGKKVILMGCYVSVKDDAFLSSLKNLHAVLPFTDYSSIEKLLLGDVTSRNGETIQGLNLDALSKLKQGVNGLKEGNSENILLLLR